MLKHTILQKSKRCISKSKTHLSRLFARLEIQILLLATAKGFQRRGFCILFSKDPLKRYADFTKEYMQGHPDRRRLFRIAFRLGRLLRLISGFRNPQDLERLVFYLYRNIGITMTGSIPGKILVSECYFSRVYSAGECSCISAMDAGIISGICNCGTLKFDERITEGCKFCVAHVPNKRT